MKNEKYMLVLENRPGDFMPISINILIHNNMIHFDNIESIDGFTIYYKKDDIMEMIKKENIVPDEYLNGTLKIINSKKYRFPVLTNEIHFSFDEFVINNIENKQNMNKLENIVLKYTKEGYLKMHDYIKNRNIQSIINVYRNYPYIIQRNIFFYLYNLS